MSEKLQRILQVAGLIQTGRHNIESLANACGVRERTIYRDLRMLRRSGIPVAYDKNRERYSILEGFAPPVPKNAFNVDEAAALLSLCFGADGNAIVPLMEPAQSASAKITDLLPRAIKEELKHLGSFFQIVPEPGEDDETSRPVFQVVFESFRRRQALRIWYGNDGTAEICTLLHPYHLVHVDHAWRVLGRSSFHREVRWFKLKRIVRYEETDTEFTLPERFFWKRHLEKWRQNVQGRAEDDSNQ